MSVYLGYHLENRGHRDGGSSHGLGHHGLQNLVGLVEYRILIYYYLPNPLCQLLQLHYLEYRLYACSLEESLPSRSTGATDVVIKVLLSFISFFSIVDLFDSSSLNKLMTFDTNMLQGLSSSFTMFIFSFESTLISCVSSVKPVYLLG